MEGLRPKGVWCAGELAAPVSGTGDWVPCLPAFYLDVEVTSFSIHATETANSPPFSIKRDLPSFRILLPLPAGARMTRSVPSTLLLIPPLFLGARLAPSSAGEAPRLLPWAFLQPHALSLSPHRTLVVV